MPSRSNRRPASDPRPPQARMRGRTLQSTTTGALPIINALLRRTRLEELLEVALPQEDRRVRVRSSQAILLLMRNILLSREPIYGLGEWATRHTSAHVGVGGEHSGALNDDRIGRALDTLFAADVPSLVLSVMTHVVREFQVSLDELHNDSTTISFHGDYTEASTAQRVFGRQTVAITHGHSKDHRPDLKQLLFILTVTADGGVPLAFRAESGNVVDDQTHRETWDLLCQLTGRRDFLYVADCKLATSENMAYIHQRQGRFITVLPRTRREDAAFRTRIRQGQHAWTPIWEKTDDDGTVVDVFATSEQPTQTVEGYRLLWFHSVVKSQCDAVARLDRIERALRKLTEFQEKLRSPRTRYRQRAKVEDAVAKIIEDCGAGGWVRCEIKELTLEQYRQEHKGRPGKTTRYVKRVATRFDFTTVIDELRIAEDAVCDGVFPLVTNVQDMTPLEVLHAYKRQPDIEKRFSQLKNDFFVAPVYLKSVRRIQAILAVYFFVLLVEALLEREARQAMKRLELDSLPLYPERRPCRRPTARRIIDVLETIQQHTLIRRGKPEEVMVTEPNRLQRKLIKLFGMNPATYGR